MKNLLRSILSPWIALVLCALGLVILLDAFRVRRIEHVSAIGEETGGSNLPAPGGWQPGLIVPEHDNTSLAWLSQTRQMLETGESRIRRIDYDNAPFGRDVYSASPYRWWLGTVAWSDHLLTGAPLGQALERAALFANPLLHLLLLVALAVFVGWRFGLPAAATAAMLAATTFPLAGEFLPGLPRDSALTAILALGALLPICAAFFASADRQGPRVGGWFIASGVIGGLGLWVSVYRGMPVLLSCGLGALLAAWIGRPERSPGAGTASFGIEPRLWRYWSLSGAITTLVAYLVEFSPDYLGLWQLRAVHPLYALAWIGLGELLVTTTALIGRQPSGHRVAWISRVFFGLLATASLPVALKLTKSWGFLATDLDRLRLAHLPTGPSAANSFTWILHEGLNFSTAVTLMPLLLVGPAVWVLSTRRGRPGERVAIAFCLGALALQVGFAGRWLSSWNDVGLTLLLLAVVLAGALRSVVQTRPGVLAVVGIVTLLAVPGLVELTPRDEAEGPNSIDPREIYALLERDLARWLAQRTNDPRTIVLAPHNVSATLQYYGRLRGLSSLAWENTEGLGAAIRITSASTPEEARELLTRRQVTYVVMPTWDAYLDVYAGIGMGELDGTFQKKLLEWKLPAWMNAVPYQMPKIGGLDGESVLVLQLVEDQDDPAALSRLAEYFVEMTQLDRAATTAQALRRFPADFGALVARAQVEFARGESAAFERTLSLIKPRLTSGGDRSLPWDRRLSLCVVLTQAKLKDLAREQVRRCIEELDEAKLRSLSTGGIYRLLVLSRAYAAPVKDESLRMIALSLLPSDMRERVQ